MDVKINEREIEKVKTKYSAEIPTCAITAVLNPSIETRHSQLIRGK